MCIPCWLVACLIVCCMINLFTIIVLSLENPKYFYKLMLKQKEEGLSLLNVLGIIATPIAHLWFGIKHFVFDNDDNIVYNFFHRPRFFKGK